MVEKRYDWAAGAKLEEHTKRKHRILREYFFNYLRVRCQHPHREVFRLAVIDGFAGGGRYECGSAGSPIIFIEEIRNAINAINLNRVEQNLRTIEIECLFIFNDDIPEAIEILKSNIAPLHAEVKDSVRGLQIHVVYLNEKFETAYGRVKQHLEQSRVRNVIFNLDQYGYKHVERNTLLDILQSYSSAEIFYTFAITSLLTFLQKSDPKKLMAQLAPIGLNEGDLHRLDGKMSNHQWLGTAERIVFETFQDCASYVSPFSINNPGGWRYWLIHFANNYRARQVYNDILHQNSGAQAHFGRSGLNMLSYDPAHDDGNLYLFDMSGQNVARKQLLDDIPRLISESGDVMDVGEFYNSIYNMTPAHMDDIHSAIMDNPDIEVITPAGGERRKANTIGIGDSIKLRKQRSFYPVFRSDD